MRLSYEGRVAYTCDFLGARGLHAPFLPLGPCLTPLAAIDAGLGSLLDVEPPSPFGQVRFEPGLEVSQDLLYGVPVHFPIRRRLRGVRPLGTSSRHPLSSRVVL